MATILDDTDRNLFYSGPSWNTTLPSMAGATIDRYHDKTAHNSRADAEFVEVKWTGTDIAIYGARRGDHGIYSVILDSAAKQFFSGLATTLVYQQALFATSGLGQGEHTLRVTNEPSRNAPEDAKSVNLDIDFIAFNGVVRDARPGFGNQASSSAPSPAKVSSSTSTSSPSASSPPPPASSDASPTSSAVPSSSSEASAVSSVITAQSFSASGVLTLTASSTAPAGFDTAMSRPSAASIKTTGQPSLPTGHVEPTPSGSSDTSNNTVVIAVSSTVIAVAVLVIATVLGLWWHRRRKRMREMEEADVYENMYDQPQSWNKM